MHGGVDGQAHPTPEIFDRIQLGMMRRRDQVAQPHARDIFDILLAHCLVGSLTLVHLRAATTGTCVPGSEPTPSLKEISRPDATSPLPLTVRCGWTQCPARCRSTPTYDRGNGAARSNEYVNTSASNSLPQTHTTSRVVLCCCLWSCETTCAWLGGCEGVWGRAWEHQGEKIKKGESIKALSSEQTA